MLSSYSRRGQTESDSEQHPDDLADLRVRVTSAVVGRPLMRGPVGASWPAAGISNGLRNLSLDAEAFVTYKKSRCCPVH